MPILDVEIVGDISPREGLAQRIADAAGEALGSRPRGPWVKLHFIDRALYAENAADGSESVEPVIVRVIQAAPPSGDDLQAQIDELTRALSAVTGRPAENVHIVVEPPALGRIAFGGKLRN